ncbi:F-box protein CPR1-like [Silene latifolia]|uniref:F-box protein CPR1-like n=1 Tax=Silene latifolia TaxID=37657 RepID=UPI003D786EC3
MKTIPQEILTNILARLPAKSIGRCRCVSKPWCHLLSEPHFIKAHLDLTKEFMDNERITLISSVSNTLFSTSITHHSSAEITSLATELSFVVAPDFWTEGMPSCDGLILIGNDANKRLLVNSTTNKTRELTVSPYALDPHGSFTMYGLGYDHVSDDYKVVTLSYYDTDNEYEPDCTEMFVNVYSVRNGTWKQAESSPYDHAVGHLVSGVFVGGFIHWLASRTSDYSSAIVRFDLTEEKFSELPAPSSVDGENFVLNRLAVLGGCLCMSPSNSQKETEIWVMKEYGVEQSWSKLLVVDQKASEFRPLMLISDQREVVMVKDEETVVEKLVVYNLDSATFKDITIQGAGDEFQVGGSFIETLVSPYYNDESRRV